MGRTWRIGEVAARTGLTPRTLRHYDELGLLVPSARSWGDYRLYDEADLLRLLQVQNLKALGLSLAEIADALADPELDAGATLRSHLAHLEDRIAAEQALAGRLRALAESSDRTWDDVLSAIELTQRLAHPDPAVRLRAALQSPASTPELLSALAGEHEPGVRDTLVWALAHRPDAAAAVLERLDDPDPALRAALLRVLGKLGAAEHAGAVTARLADPDPAVVAAAVQALGRLAAPESSPALVALLGTGTVPDDVLDALVAVGPPALDALADAVGSPSADARAAAAEAVGRISATAPGVAARAAGVLAPLLADADATVRLTALVALGDLGAEGRPALRTALADPALAGVAGRLLDRPPT